VLNFLCIDGVHDVQGYVKHEHYDVIYLFAQSAEAHRKLMGAWLNGPNSAVQLEPGVKDTSFEQVMEDTPTEEQTAADHSLLAGDSLPAAPSSVTHNYDFAEDSPGVSLEQEQPPVVHLVPDGARVLDSHGSWMLESELDRMTTNNGGGQEIEPGSENEAMAQEVSLDDLEDLEDWSSKTFQDLLAAYPETAYSDVALARDAANLAMQKLTVCEEIARVKAAIARAVDEKAFVRHHRCL
jgi:hypothetical protein